MMKKIEAIIHPFELIDVREALNPLGIEEITVSDVIVGISNSQKNDRNIRRRGEYIGDVISKIKLEIAVKADMTEAVREALEKAICSNDMKELLFSSCEFYETSSQTEVGNGIRSEFGNEIENFDTEEEENVNNTTEVNHPAAFSLKGATLSIKKEKQDSFASLKKYGIQGDSGLSQNHGMREPLIIRKKSDDNSFNFIWKVTKTSELDIRAVTVISKNIPGIFSKLAGVFTLNGFDIVHARSYRQGENTLDIFKVRAFPGHEIDERAFDIAEKNLKDVLSGRLDLSNEFLKKMVIYSRMNPHKKVSGVPQVTVNNDDSLLFSIIEVSADDFPGLLFRITDALFKCGLKVWMSKISTKGDRVIDTFYVKDNAEKKVESPLQVANIQAMILDAIS
jgi:[protein-PII] uridylyltransferase